MSDTERLRGAIDDLIGVVHLLASEVQRLVTHVEQQTIRIPGENQLPLVLSELSELHGRVRGLAADVGAHEPGS